MAAKETEKMTIEQVADALGLSKTTVSRALSGKGRISEETRTKVYAYMGRTRSEPVSAQSGEKLRTNNIAMVVPQRFIALDLPFLRKCMGGICTMADQRGYDLMLCYASNTEYSQLQRQLANHKVDGVILTYAMADDPCIELLRQYETPFVLIGRSEDKTIPQADNDQVAAACEMTRILLQLGAKRHQCRGEWAPHPAVQPVHLHAGAAGQAAGRRGREPLHPAGLHPQTGACRAGAPLQRRRGQRVPDLPCGQAAPA